MEKKFNAFIRKEGLLLEEGTALLAISGGVDSVVLFHILRQQNIDFHCAHVNYSLRGEASDEDERFVRELCSEYKIGLDVLKINTAEYCEQNKLSVQEGARKIRYDYFHELVSSGKYTRILTAHHADDSIETFFINLIRGTGIKGLAGIKIKNGIIERPLLFANKQLIEDFAKRKNLAFRQDQSNLENKYLRNRIRNQIIPVIEESSNEFKNSMYDNMDRIKQGLIFLNFSENEFKKKYVESKNGHDYINKLILESQESAYPMHSVLSAYGFTSSQVSGLYLKPKQGSTFSSSTHKLFVDRDHLAIKKIEPYTDPLEMYPIQNIADFAKLPFQITATIEVKENVTINPNPRLAYLDNDKISEQVIFRKWKTGDSIKPLGMYGKKSIGDYLQQKKVPTYEKENQWLLISDEEVAWVCGHGISEDFKISDTTTTVLILEL